MRLKKILYVLIIVALVAVVAFALYTLFGKHATTTTITPPVGNGSLPGITTSTNSTGPLGNSSSSSNSANATFGIITNDAVLDYSVSVGNIVTAIEPDGSVIQVLDGNVSNLSSLPIQNVITGSVSYDGSRAFINFGDPDSPQTSIFNVAQKTWTPMPQGWQSPSWAPSDQRIAYIMDGQNGSETLYVIDASKSKISPAPLITIHAGDLIVSWLNKNQLILSTKPSAYSAGSALLFDLQKGTLAPVILSQNGLMTTWSGSTFGSSAPMGLALSVGSSQFGGSLSLINTSGAPLEKLKFITLPSKCVFGSETSTVPSINSSTTPSSTSVSVNSVAESIPYLFCAVPRNQSALTLTHLPDDYDQMAFFTSDDVQQVNLDSGAVKTLFADPAQNLDISDPKIFNDMLFFINRYDQKLYGLQLVAGS